MQWILVLFFLFCVAFALYVIWKKFRREVVTVPFFGMIFDFREDTQTSPLQATVSHYPTQGPPPPVPKKKDKTQRAIPTKVGSGGCDSRGTPKVKSIPVCRDVEYGVGEYEHAQSMQFPAYWTKKGKALSSSDGALRHQVTQKSLDGVQALMDGTWSDIRTRDRKGGAEIKKFQVVQVLRIENMNLWQQYVNYRGRIADACSTSQNFQQHNVQTHVLRNSDSQVGRLMELMDFDASANEFLLFHGTKPTSASAICENGFFVNLAGSHSGSLYGPGVYLAERSSKADEYAEDDREGVYQGLYAMLLCRATCGAMSVSEDVKPNVKKLMRSILDTGEYHSVLGDREKARGTYREFIVYDSGQVYPELIIIYRRLDAAKGSVSS